MKHKEHDVIIAYAKGAKVQSRMFSGETWEDEENPGFYDWREYRVKPREFETGAFYVARIDSDLYSSTPRSEVVQYEIDGFLLTGDGISPRDEKDFSYIGDKIELEDYVEDDSI